MKINFKRIDHVQLVIPPGTEDTARDFYSGVLGLEEIQKPGPLKPTGGVWFKIADGELHLGVENPAPAFGEAGGVNSKAHPAFEVTDLSGIKEYLILNGIEIKEEIPIPGRKRFTFRDPFGNRIEFLEIE